jgi:SDR family mycofactocin-dependent oxidoreductase
MTQQFDGRVAFITGAAREEGADIIAVDVCAQIDSVAYPLATPQDMEETVNLVEKTGRRIVAEQADVRDFSSLKSVVQKGVRELGRLDFVLANAGILPIIGPQAQQTTAFTDAVDVMLTGVFYTIEAALPALLEHGEGGAIVITSSIAGLTGMRAEFEMKNPGSVGYLAAKHGVVGLMRGYANALAKKNIRVNTVHPSATATPMVVNEQVGQLLAEVPEYQSAWANLLPVPVLEDIDISEAMVYLCGRSGRYVTGITLPVDAGYTVK